MRTDPTAAYAGRLPAARPTGLRLTTLRRTWYRIDGDEPAHWEWAPFADPRHRFDPASSGFRVRYAADTARGAMRERFDGSGRRMRRTDLELHLVELTGTVRVLDLRLERTLDALGLDDQINTARAPGVWLACQRLADLVAQWFGERCHGIAYRSRTTPQHGVNLAFLERAPLAHRSAGRLGERDDLLAACVLSDGFAVMGWR